MDRLGKLGITANISAKPGSLQWHTDHHIFISQFMIKNEFFNVANRTGWVALCLALGLEISMEKKEELTPEVALLVKKLKVSLSNLPLSLIPSVYCD